MSSKSPSTMVNMKDSGGGGPKKTPVQLFCFNLTNSTGFVQLMLCTMMVMVFYLLYGYIQELMFRELPGFRKFGWTLTLWQFLLYSCFSFSERLINSHEQRKIPIFVYAQLAFYTVITMGFSNAAVGYLNYPTQVIFKCCKLIPVLIGGIIIQGKRYGFVDVLAALCMSVGLILFTLADNKVSPNFDIKGYVMICIALLSDAVIGNVQEKKIKAFGARNSEVILYSYGIGIVYIVGVLLVTGEVFDSLPFFVAVRLYLKIPPKIAFFIRMNRVVTFILYFCSIDIWNVWKTFGYGALFSATGYLGINIVLTLVRRFGALIAVTVTTLRKGLTILLSFMLFSKPFTFQYIWSGGLVLLGIYLSVYAKNQESWNRSIVSCIQRPIAFGQMLALKFRSRSHGDPYVV